MNVGPAGIPAVSDGNIEMAVVIKTENRRCRVCGSPHGLSKCPVKDFNVVQMLEVTVCQAITANVLTFSIERLGIS